MVKDPACKLALNSSYMNRLIRLNDYKNTIVFDLFSYYHVAMAYILHTCDKWPLTSR